jgi:hypothetical protein
MAGVSFHRAVAGGTRCAIARRLPANPTPEVTTTGTARKTSAGFIDV